MVCLFLADGFEEIEAMCPLDLLRRANIKVTTISVKSDKTVTGAHGISIIADVSCDDIPNEKIDMIIIPGGGIGVNNLNQSLMVHQLIDKAHREGAFIAAICAAPMILGEKGLLKGKKAICYPGFEKYLTGAIISDEKVVRDGNFITAKGMGVSLEFGLALVEALLDMSTAIKVKEAVMA